MMQRLDRAFIAIGGVDRASFLQGLITQDIFKVSPTTPCYSMLLTPQGRFLYDFFIIQQSDYYLLDVAAGMVEGLMKKLSLYKLRASVTIEIRQDVQVIASLHKNETLGKQGFLDPRLAALGWRYYLSADFQGTDTWDYRRHALEWGVPNGEWDLIPEKSIPLECNAYEMGALCFHKGCYLGQELTARTKHTGMVRKRLLPGSTFVSLKEGWRLYMEGKEIGSIQSVYKDLFLARVQQAAFIKAIQGHHPILSEDSTPVTMHLPGFLKLTDLMSALPA